MLVLAIATAAIIVWSAWLCRTRQVPGWLPALGWSVVASTLTTCTLSWRRLHQAFAAVSTDEAGNKASLLAQRISDAMRILVIGGTIALAAAIVLLYFTIRAPRRDAATGSEPPRARWLATRPRR